MTLLNDSLSAYLTPLLEKHTAGKAIIYDDLIHSWQAAQEVIKTDFDPAVSKRLRELHESQLLAYEEAARAALNEHAQSVALPSVSEDMDEEAYISKTLSDSSKPDWKVNEIVWEQAWQEPLRERARAVLLEQQQVEDNDTEEQMEDGEEEEEVDDGDEEEEDEEEEKPKPDTVKKVTKVTPKKRTIATKASKGLLKMKALGGTAPGTQRAVRGRRSRRGGRGGGNAGAAK